jgi:uncharacterized protein (TIGR03437 family)
MRWISGWLCLALPLGGQGISPSIQTVLLTTPLALPLVGPGAELREIAEVRMNSAARIVLLGRYAPTRTATTLATGLFELAGGDLTPLLLDQQQTSLGGSTVYSDLRQLALNDSGTIVAAARAGGRNLVLRIQGSTLATLEAENAWGLNNRGEALVGERGGLRVWSASGVRRVAESGGAWQGITGGAINDAGQVVFAGRGVWLVEGSSVRALAQYRDLIPGLFPQTFVAFANPVISEHGAVAFAAQTRGRVPGFPAGYNSEGVFVWRAGDWSVAGPSGFAFSASDKLVYAAPPRPAFDGLGNVYWSAQVGSAPVVLRWRPGPGLEVFAQSALSLVPTGAGLLLLAGRERIELLSTLGLSNGATPGRLTTRLAEGSIATLFAPGAGEPVPAAATGLPLPRRLGGVEVLVGGRPAPLFYAGGEQVNFQVPAGLAGNQLVRAVRAGSVRGLGLLTPQANPALFAVVTNQDGSVNSPWSAAPRSSALTLYGTGVRPTASLSDGEPAPASGQPLFYTSTTPTVWIGGARAQVLFSGLTPGLVGVWQINVMVPAAPPTLSGAPVRVWYDGIETNTITAAVR